MAKNATASLSIGGREFLLSVLIHLRQNKEVDDRTICLGKEHCVQVEVADDSDGHRTRKGYLCYEEVDIIKINGRTHLVAVACDSIGYPANLFITDMMIFPCPAWMMTERRAGTWVKEMLPQHSYLKDSPFIIVSGGLLGVNKKTPIGDKLMPIIQGTDYIAQEAQVNPDILTLDLRPTYTRPQLYKYEASAMFASEIMKVLHES